MKLGLVLEGGAMRAIFTAGALDYLNERKATFSYVIGVSAGAGTAINYISGQTGRSKKVIMHENTEAYFGLKTLRKSGKLLNLEQLVVEYAKKDFPFDFAAFHASDVELECVGVNCEAGKAEYFNDFSDDERLMKCVMATCSVPFVCEPLEIDGRFYLDGSVADSVPVERALERGCDKVVAILTRPVGYSPTDYAKMKLLINRFYRKKYPALCETLIQRKTAYEAQMARIRKLEKDHRVFLLRPTTCIGHFEQDEKKLDAFYQNGYDTMKEQYDAMQAFLYGKTDEEKTSA